MRNVPFCICFLSLSSKLLKIVVEMQLHYYFTSHLRTKECKYAYNIFSSYTSQEIRHRAAIIKNLCSYNIMLKYCHIHPETRTSIHKFADRYLNLFSSIR